MLGVILFLPPPKPTRLQKSNEISYEPAPLPPLSSSLLKTHQGPPLHTGPHLGEFFIPFFLPEGLNVHFS